DDCTFTVTGYATNIVAGSLLMRRCEIIGGANMVNHSGGQRCEIEDCTFRNGATGIASFSDYGTALSVKHCSFYGMTTGDIVANWSTADSFSDLVALNNIHVDSAVVYTLPSRTRLSNVNHNCIHGATKVGLINATDYTTLANWQAYADDEGASPDADSFTDDPLLVSPGTGDFTLGAASPCRGVGIGAGVASYIDGTAADPHHPNIGATGTADDPPAPSWAGGLSNVTATNQHEGDGVSLSWDAATIGGSGLSIEYCAERRIGLGAWTRFWIGAGLAADADELTPAQLYEFRIGARCSDYEQAWQYAADSDTETPTWLSAPTWAGGISNVAATDSDSDGEVDLSWDAAAQAEGGAVGYVAEYRTTAGPGAWTEAFRTNALTGTVSGITNDAGYDFRIIAFARDANEASTTGADTASATPTWPGTGTAPTISGATVSSLVVTVTIVGTAGHTYRARISDGVGTADDEGDRVGSGTIVLTALGYGIRYLVVWEIVDGHPASEPSALYIVALIDPTVPASPMYRVVASQRIPGTPYKQLTLEKVERPVNP
ncbi:MAG TPA: fibronectin type III domain-containing protein, partial [Planctomycetota bacterium]|nr:fibronectin type III domain-containing protein [Planctomycetota bacterium]